MDNHFFAVFVQSSYHVPGDERSRTNPGHGYPANDVHYAEVIKFDDEEQLQAWIENEEKRGFSKKVYEAVRCYPLKVTTQVKVECV